MHEAAVANCTWPLTLSLANHGKIFLALVSLASSDACANVGEWCDSHPNACDPIDDDRDEQPIVGLDPKVFRQAWLCLAPEPVAPYIRSTPMPETSVPNNQTTVNRNAVGNRRKNHSIFNTYRNMFTFHVMQIVKRLFQPLFDSRLLHFFMLQFARFGSHLVAQVMQLLKQNRALFNSHETRSKGAYRVECLIVTDNISNFVLD